MIEIKPELDLFLWGYDLNLNKFFDQLQQVLQVLFVIGRFFSSNTKETNSIRPVYYSILNSFGQRSQYMSIKFPLYKQSENP